MTDDGQYIITLLPLYTDIKLFVIKYLAKKKPRKILRGKLHKCAIIARGGKHYYLT